MPFDAVFDARSVQPQQGSGRHQIGNKFPAKITGTEVKQVQGKQAGLFAVEFTSPGGTIVNNYNLWNDNETARKIANQELSALCHATGIFQLDFKNDGAALRGGGCLIDVNFQKGHEPSAEKPDGGYVEIKKVYDMAGNEPGKGPAPQAQSPQQSYQPAQQQTAPQQANQGNWGGGAPPQQQAAPQQSWGGNGQQANNSAPNQAAGTGGWQQNANGPATANPPWGGQT
jgi:hypothetical protein